MQLTFRVCQLVLPSKSGLVANMFSPLGPEAAAVHDRCRTLRDSMATFLAFSFERLSLSGTPPRLLQQTLT